jgi:HipA N-terminal domain
VTTGGAVPAFFVGLLPEGVRLGVVTTSTKTSADDHFTLLLAIGADTIGDVRVNAKRGRKGGRRPRGGGFDGDRGRRPNPAREFEASADLSGLRIRVNPSSTVRHITPHNTVTKTGRLGASAGRLPGALV